MTNPEPFRTIDNDPSFLAQIVAATQRFVDTSGDPPPIPWFIDDWMPEFETTLLAGSGGGGKSYLTLQLQASTALGTSWLGLPVPQCPSLGFYSEDGFEAVANRLHWIAMHHRTTVAELFRLGMRILPKPKLQALIAFEGRFGQMGTTKQWDDLRRTIDVLSPKLLVLDNLADYLPLPSFDNGAIRRARHLALDPLCEQHQLTVVGLQNVTLQGLRATDEAADSSGGLAWRDAFRSRLSLRVEKPAAVNGDADQDDNSDGNGRGRKLCRIKNNNAADDETGIPLHWQSGLWVPNQPAGGLIDRLEKQANERWLKEAVIRVVQSRRSYSLGNNRSNYLPNILAQQPDRPKGFGAKSVRATFERLVCSDSITVRQARDPAQRRFVDRVVAVDGHNLQAE